MPSASRPTTRWERAVAELLTRPVGRPSHKPVVRYKSVRYQAASWTTARRGTAEQVIKGRQGGGEADAALVPPVPGERGAAVAERGRLQPGEHVAAARAAEAAPHPVAAEPTAPARDD